MDKKIITSFSFEVVEVGEQMNSGISPCTVKVFYPGKNRNGSFITKGVGTQMAQTLPNIPIVAFYDPETNDFGDHGREIVINSKGIEERVKTIPYGFVNPNGTIGWKEYIEKDGSVKEYMVCQGYLWTGRYPELEPLTRTSKGHSMELNPESIVGEWATFDNDDEEFFIFSEAEVSALCILGDGIEPCFEGSTIGPQELFYSLVKDNEETKNNFALFMKDIKEALENEEGGSSVMDKVKIEDSTVEPVVDNTVEPVEPVITENEENTQIDASLEDNEVAVPAIEKEEDENTLVVDNTQVEEPTVIVEESEITVQEFAQLEDKYRDLKTKYDALEADYNALIEVNIEKENEAKTDLINSFAILGEDTINDFKAKVSDYSYEQLDEKLSALAFKKGINFTKEEEDVVTPVTQEETVLPAWVAAVKDKENN